MKPLRLTLNAVGPYPGTQVVDFRSVLESRLFGIYGPTGAGKSTIFSAMTFALFGEAARTEQHASTLRSDHADPSRMTEVEFIFETGGRVYRIVRRPDQMRPAKRGGGETKEPHKATFFDVTGIDLEQISDATPGKVLAEQKVDTVNTAIIDLLGYGAVQFRQIVLLPQGRFETFLAANTPERVKILRELFDVSLYSRLAEQVKAKADAAEYEVTNTREVCAKRLTAEGFATPGELTAGIAIAGEEFEQQKGAAAASKVLLEAANQKYQVAALTDQAFAEHLAADNAFAAIKAETDAISALGARVGHARAAQLLADADEGIAKARTDAEAMADATATADENLARAEARAKLAAEALATLVGKSPEHEADKLRLQEYQTLKERFEACGPLQTKHNEALAKAEDDATRAQKSKTRHEDIIRRQGDTAKHLEIARSNQLHRAELVALIAGKNQLLHTARQYERLRNDLAVASASVTRHNTEATKAILSLEESTKKFNEAEAALIRDHALHIAAHLEAGEPCPACGSRDHPAPAHGNISADSLSAAYQLAKTALDAARKLADEARTRLAVAQEKLETCQAAFGGLPVPELTVEALEEELARATAAQAGLGPEIDIARLEKSLSDLATSVATAHSTSQSDQSVAAESDKKAALAQQALHDALKAIPEDLRSTDALAARLESLSRKISDYSTALGKAQENDRKEREALASARTAKDNAVANQKRSRDQLAEAQTAFAKRMADAGLTDAEYKRGKADVGLLPEIESRIADHRDRFSRADERLLKARAAIENVDRPDITALLDARNEAETVYNTANDLAAATNARLSHLEKLATELSDELARLQRLEQESGPLRELAEAFSGKNEMKMNLETFAIATMFDQVLEAANLRYGPMSRGRYALVRETEGRGNARRGLGLCVDDAHTGHQRPTSTLSGGETFIAALALALGLSDIVESTTANIHLDTIFIDEGFGSLDSDGDSGTLEQVLETLQNVVGQNRTVGVISHVALVQQAIPNGFWITKTTGGSQIEVRT